MKINLFKKIYINTREFIEEDIKNKFKTKEELYFLKQFKQYLEVEDVLFCYEMLEEGFKITQLQKNKLDNLLVNKLQNNTYKYKDIKNFKTINPEIKLKALIYSIDNYEFIEELNDIKKNEYNNSFIEFFENYKNKTLFLKCNKQLLNNLKKHYKSGIDSNGEFSKVSYEDNDKMIKEYKYFFSTIAIMIKNEILNYQEINEIKEQIKDVCEYITNITNIKYPHLSFNKIEKYSIDKFLECLGNYQSQILSKDNKKDILLKQLKSYNARNKSLTQEIKDLINQEDYSIDKLPVEAKNKIENINKVAKLLNSKDVNDFLHERLPLILKKYFSIDEEYRISLKNIEGLNAQELMIQSLDNIEKLILAKNEDQNIDLITELSIENRKLKNHMSI